MGAPGSSTAGPAGPSTTVADVIVPTGNFGPHPSGGKRRLKTAYGQQISDENVAMMLGNGHPKSVPVKVHKGMEGERTGLPHLTPHSLRYRQAHEKMGTKIASKQVMT